MAIIERQSIIDAPAGRVWARVVTPEGINDELRPWMTMSMPRGMDGMDVDDLPIGIPVGRCWMRLFGVLPFDYDRLCIVDLEPGRRFDEQSTMMTMRQWRHERSIADEGKKTVVRDRITFELRGPIRVLTPVVAVGVKTLFGHRHRRLQRHFAAGG
jgi:ligand-binding SRPBCC domain-containing protein